MWGKGAANLHKACLTLANLPHLLRLVGEGNNNGNEETADKQRAHGNAQWEECLRRHQWVWTQDNGYGHKDNEGERPGKEEGGGGGDLDVRSHETWSGEVSAENILL